MEVGNVAAPVGPQADDWQFCDEVLTEVSRTFSQPIFLLPPPLRRALTVGYLLCRVADTIEDCTEPSAAEKERLFANFSEVLAGQLSPSTLSSLAALPSVSSGERKLIGGLPRLLRALGEQPPRARTAILRWVSTMAEGMAAYCKQRATTPLWAPKDLPDLERYCFFVAGTVGHLVTDLFVDWHRQAGEDAESLEAALRPQAEAFGQGLQLVNIIKDVTDDFPSGVCFIPESVCRAEGIAPEELLLGENRDRALRASQVLIDRAWEHLEVGLGFTLALPTSPPGLRLFCLLPLFMALETLAVAQQGDARVIRGAPVKISRDAVARIIADCGRFCQSNEAIVERFLVLASEREGRAMPADAGSPDGAARGDGPRHRLRLRLESLQGQEGPAGGLRSGSMAPGAVDGLETRRS